MHANSLANLKKGKSAPRCSYTRINDQPCTQPAMHGRAFCRFHDLVDHPLPDARLIPFVEDATTLQLALMQVIKSLQRGQIDRHTAGTILYALQIAASNLPHFCEENGHPFAPPAARKTKKQEEEEEALQGPSFAEILMERLQLVDPAEDGNKQNVAPPSPSAASVVKDVPPNAVPSRNHQINGSPDGGLIDKLEACDSKAPSSAAISGNPQSLCIH